MFSSKISAKINGRKHSHQDTTNAWTDAPLTRWRSAALWLTLFIIMSKKWPRSQATTMMPLSSSRNSAFKNLNRKWPARIGDSFALCPHLNCEKKKLSKKLNLCLKANTLRLCQTQSIYRGLTIILISSKKRFYHKPQKPNFKTFCKVWLRKSSFSTQTSQALLKSSARFWLTTRRNNTHVLQRLQETKTKMKWLRQA